MISECGIYTHNTHFHTFFARHARLQATESFLFFFFFFLSQKGTVSTTYILITNDTYECRVGYDVEGGGKGGEPGDTHAYAS